MTRNLIKCRTKACLGSTCHTLKRNYLKIILLGLLLLASACGKVKPYQKMHLNQDSMKLNDNHLKNFETNFLSYREGASGGNGGKTGGGCGCN